MIVLRARYGFASILLLTTSTAMAQQRLSESTGVNLFTNNCTQCHGAHPVERAPSEATIRQMPPERIYEVITTGEMKAMAEKLSDNEKRLLAEFIGGRKIDTRGVGDAKNMPNGCATHPAALNMNAPMWNGWSDLSNTRFQNAKAAGLSAGQVSRLKLMWTFGFPGATATYGQTVADGRVFVSSNAGYVYALDAETGCLHWSFKAAAGVRSNITIGPLKKGGSKMAAFFGDIRGNGYALDTSSGELLWKVQIDAHPLARVTANPKYYDGHVYFALASLEEDESRSANYICCTFRGVVASHDSETGKQLWKSYTIPDQPKVIKKNSVGVDYMGPSGAGVWSTPIIDTKRRAIYFGTGNSFSEPATYSDSVMAMDLDSGKMLWWNQTMKDDIWHGGCQQTIPGRARGGAGGPGRGNQPPYPSDNCVDKTGPDWDYGATFNLVPMADGRTVIIAPQKQGVVRAHDPDKKGAVIWEQDLARAISGGSGETVFGGAVDDKTAYFGIHVGGGIAAVDLATGVEKWFTPWKPAAGMETHRGVVAAVSVIPGVLFAGGMDGMLRAVSTYDGRTIWEFNTAQEFQTINGITAKGGSIGAQGPSVANGMVFVSSGYVGFQNGVPGNVLLAFKPQP